MAEENQEPAKEEPKVESAPEEQEDSNKKYYIIGAVIIGLLIILGLGYLLISGSSSNTVNVVNPPATSEVTPVPTPGKMVSITGLVAISGTPPSNSTVTIGAKVKGTDNWEPVVTDLSSREPIEYVWKQALEGTTYDMQAFLVDSGGIFSQSQVSQTTAPTSNVNFEIIVSELPPPPKGSLQVDCVQKNTSTMWQVSLTYNINNPTTVAKQYRLGIGTSRTGDLILDAVVVPSSPDVTQTYTTDYIVAEGQTYFAAYAYASCASCDEFSEVSEWVQFSCTETSTPTPTKSPSPASPTGTPTPTL